MSATRRAVAIRLIVFLGTLGFAFVVLQRPVRHLEAVVAARLTEWLSGQSTSVLDAVIVVRPTDQSLFVALLTPACSALAAAGSICLLGAVAPRVSRGRKVFAVAAAVSVVVIGNFARLSGSLLAGAWSGQASLVAFHDSVGSVLTFIYILGGYVLMLWMLLPADRTPTDVQSIRRERDHVLV